MGCSTSTPVAGRAVAKEEATLYTVAVSANNIAVTTLLAHKGTKNVVIKPLDIFAGETQTPEFVKLNPNHGTPTLEYAPGKSLYESNAILRYFANANSYTDVYPSDPVARARVDAALDWQQTSYYTKLTAVFYPALGFSAAFDKVEEAKAPLYEVLDLFVKIWLQDGNKFVGGAKPSIADFKFAATFNFFDADKSFEVPAAIQKYRKDFAAAVPTFKETTKAYYSYLDQLAAKK
jgi:glutathione S-transferase